ncbi:MAG: hypothetical protein ACE5HK_00360 [Candidatus Methylomirabilales bacterium]
MHAPIEARYFLGTGESFRTHRANELIRTGAAGFFLRGRFRSPKGPRGPSGAVMGNG